MGPLAFAHPLYLWGLLATALPILVHLFNQRRPRPLAFGAIDFVLRSQRQKARRLRLRQLQARHRHGTGHRRRVAYRARQHLAEGIAERGDVLMRARKSGRPAFRGASTEHAE